MKSPGILTAVAILALGVGATAAAADIQAGKAKSSACAICHGANGEGKANNPPLAGIPAERFVQAINDFKSGKRPSPIMKGYAAKLDDADSANLAAYYASLKK